MNFALLSAAILAVLGLAPNATPPDVINIYDTPFAANAETLFVIRTTEDNLGLHTSLHTESFLVAIDVATGEESYSLIYRARQDMVFDAEPAREHIRTTYYDREEWMDPLSIIADHDAYLLGARSRAESVTGALSHEAASIFRLEYAQDRVFDMSVPQALSRAEFSLASLALEVSDAPRLAPITTRDVHRMREVDWGSCEFSGEGYPVGIGAQAYQMVRIDCHNGEEYELTSVLQIAPLVAGRPSG